MSPELKRALYLGGWMGHPFVALRADFSVAVMANSAGDAMDAAREVHGLAFKRTARSWKRIADYRTKAAKEMTCNGCGRSVAADPAYGDCGWCDDCARDVERAKP